MSTQTTIEKLTQATFEEPFESQNSVCIALMKATHIVAGSHGKFIDSRKVELDVKNFLMTLTNTF